MGFRRTLRTVAELHTLCPLLLVTLTQFYGVRTIAWTIAAGGAAHRVTCRKH